MTRRHVRLLATGAALLLALGGCADTDPTGGGSAEGGDAGTIRVGSANFPESEIIAETYAQALEAQGVTVERQMQIGARDIYIAALQDGSIDLVPEYTGNLLQYLDPETAAVTPEEVNAALAEASPEGFSTLTPAPAEDKDSYNVTREFSETNGITSLADLSGYDGPLRIGGNPELAERPYGPNGLTEVYGVPAEQVTFVAISDAGGPLTVKALNDGEVDLADIYSTTPAIAENDFVTLEDPENMIMAQNVVPMISDAVATDEVREALDAVSAALSTEDLLAMNARNQGDEKASPSTIAADWLAENDLV